VSDGMTGEDTASHGAQAQAAAAAQAKCAPAATLVIFGAYGDLARRLLMPAIVNLSDAGLLSPDTNILGVAHNDIDDEGLRDALSQYVPADAGYAKLRCRISYLKGDFDDPATFAAIAERCFDNAIFYLATPASYFKPFADKLADADLLDQGRGFRRIVVEKPFGIDLASAQALNAKLLERAEEDQIYRIDHFLGKETVQNLIVARFANPVLSAIWCADFVDHIQITAAETVDVGSRGKFYDATGALRDMVPNHLLQMLSLIAMEPPASLGAEAIHDAKATLARAIRPIAPENAVRGQYRPGAVGGKDVCAYTAAPDVDPHSRTETYVAAKVEVDTPRWKGVPFYLRTGKALAARDTEIVVVLKPGGRLFAGADGKTLPPNQLVIQVQPHEGLQLEIVAKTPGLVLETTPIALDFRYETAFKIGHQTGYEVLLYDALIGDRTLFARADQIEADWRAVQPLIDAWRTGQPETYPAGSSGPAAADALLARDCRAWHMLGQGQA